MIDWREFEAVGRSYSLGELVALSDRRFIRSAYLTVLGRVPDEEGGAQYLNKIRKGASKLSILADLRFSREGQAHDPGIAGFDRALKWHRRGLWPIMGPLIRAYTGGEGETSLQRQIRAVDNRLASITEVLDFAGDVPG